MNPEIVIGPPGTGKTTALLNIIERELEQGTDPMRIAFVSFTKKATIEAKVRAAQRFHMAQGKFVWFRTLHALCFKQLELSNGAVFAGKHLKDFAEWAGTETTQKEIDDLDEDNMTYGFEEGDKILQMYGIARAKRIPLQEQYDADDQGINWSEVERVIAALLLYKKDKRLKEFTDMLEEFLEPDQECPDIDVLLVDEAQDLSLLQWLVVHKLAKVVRRFVVAGDDDQAIYEWSGAEVEHFVDMEGGVTVLGQSWRVPRLIQAKANEIIDGVEHRRPKEWQPRGSDGVVDYVSDLDNINWSMPDDPNETHPPILVLARNAYVLQNFMVPYLREKGWFYEWHQPSITPSLLAQIKNWEALRKGNVITLQAARDIYADRLHMAKAGVVGGVKRGYKELKQLEGREMVSLQDLHEGGGLLTPNIPWFDAFTRIDSGTSNYIRQMRENGEKLNARPRIRLSTIHRAKGGEAKHVVVFTDMARLSHRETLVNPDAERRTWYVAVTRAKERLTIADHITDSRYQCPWL